MNTLQKSTVFVGRVSSPLSYKDMPVVVATYSKTDSKRTIIHYTTLHEPGPYELMVPAGTHNIVAFGDNNKNLIYDKGEPSGQILSAEQVSAPAGGCRLRRYSERPCIQQHLYCVQVYILIPLTCCKRFFFSGMDHICHDDHPGDIPAGLPLEMLERRPDMVAAFNRVGEAKAAMLPSIVLSANIAALQSDILELHKNYQNPSGGVGGNLFAPIYQGGALEANVEIRTLEQKEAIAQYANMALRALGDVENALAAGKTLVERKKLLQLMVAENQRALELAQMSYRVGRTDLRSVLQQQLNLYSAQLALLRVQSEQLTQRVNLHLALGGSFDEQTREQDNGSTPEQDIANVPSAN